MCQGDRCLAYRALRVAFDLEGGGPRESVAAKEFVQLAVASAVGKKLGSRHHPLFDEVVRRVFETVWLKLVNDEFDPRRGTCVEAWLCGIAWRAACDERRRWSRWWSRIVPWEDQATANPTGRWRDPFDLAKVNAEAKALLDAVLLELRPNSRTILVLSTEGLGGKAMAAHLKVSLECAKSRQTRAWEYFGRVIRKPPPHLRQTIERLKELCESGIPRTAPDPGPRPSHSAIPKGIL